MAEVKGLTLGATRIRIIKADLEVDMEDQETTKTMNGEIEVLILIEVAINTTEIEATLDTKARDRINRMVIKEAIKMEEIIEEIAIEALNLHKIEVKIITEIKVRALPLNLSLREAVAHIKGLELPREDLLQLPNTRFQKNKFSSTMQMQMRANLLMIILKIPI